MTEVLKKYWHYVAMTVIAVGIIASIFVNKEKEEKAKSSVSKNNAVVNTGAANGNYGGTSNTIGEDLGYAPEMYLVLGQYIGIEQEKNDTSVTDEQLQEVINEELKNYRVADKVAEEGDAVDISYKAYIDGKLENNLSESDCQMVIGDQDYDIVFDENAIGKKAGDTFTVEIVNPYYFPMEEEKDYEAIKVEFVVTVDAVEEMYFDELTDAWVSDYYGEDGITTVEQYKDMLRKELAISNEEDELIEMKWAIWEKVLENAQVKGYPDILYENIVAIEEANMKYEAEEVWGQTLQEYIEENEIDVEEVYMNGVKSELTMWCIARKENLAVTDQEIEQGYQNLYEEYEYDSVEEMKKEYSAYEIERAIIEDKVITFVFENAKIIEK